MYSPKQYIEKNDLKVRRLVERNSFVTMLSFPENEKVFINHLPVIYSSIVGEENILIGHMAKQNPQWQHFKANPNATIIVNGEHSYITPRWYKSGRDVPTWNYAVVHLYGQIELRQTFDDHIDTLKQLSTYFEKPSETPWEFDLPDDLYTPESLTSAIVSFKFHTEKVDAKFKLAQSRPKEDRLGVIEGLLERSDDMSKAIRAMMLENE